MMNRLSFLVLILVLGLAVSVRPAPAAAPDAGQMLNQQRQPAPRLPARLPREAPAKDEQPPMTETGTTVRVKGFRFSGHQGMATVAELQALVADSIGKELGFAQLRGLAGRVTAFLRDTKGYLLARAYLPRQEITEGIVNIAVIAGRIDGRVRVDVEAPRRISQRLLEKIAERAVPQGNAIRMKDLERAVLTMNDLPGIASRASLAPGKTPGTTRVSIDVTEGPMLGAMVSGDNYGDRYTGTWRGTGRVTANDPFGIGDRLSVSATGAEHMAQASLAYALPLGSSGLAGSLSFSSLYYKLGEDLTALDAKGRADTVAAALTYPLVRSRRASLWTGLGVEYLALKDEAGGTVTHQKQIPMGNLNLYGNILDDFAGGGLNHFSLMVYGGHLDLTDIAAAQAADAAGARSAGDFHRATYSLARLQRLTGRLSLFGSLRGQVAGGNLDSSQKFILGGPTGVRAYPVGEASGDQGHALTVETRYDLAAAPAGHTVQMVGFFDTGWIQLHKDPWTNSVTSATGRNDYWLTGGGLGVSVERPGRYAIRASYAHEIGDNPGRTKADNDSDNLDRSGRFWVQAVAWF